MLPKFVPYSLGFRVWDAQLDFPGEKVTDKRCNPSPIYVKTVYLTLTFCFIFLKKGMLPKFVPYSLGFRVWDAQLSRGKGDRSKAQSITNFVKTFT